MTDEANDRKSLQDSSLPWKVNVRYYLEGISKTKKLLELDISEKIFTGRLSDLVADAKRILHDLSNQEIIDILYFGDWFISRLIDDEMQAQDRHGNLRAITKEDLDAIAHTDFLPLIITFLGENDFHVSHESEPEENLLHITPARFCAALALAEAYRAIEFIDFDRQGYLSGLGGYHALQVAETMALAKILSRESDYFAPLIARQEFTNRARKGAAAKLIKDADGKQAAKREARKQWVDWQNGLKSHKSGAAFARHIVDNLPIENTKTVERWIQEWRAERKK